MEKKLMFQVEDFVGPLDLLLTLLGQRRMDVRDVPILSLIEQYLSIISGWQQRDLEVASEFLTMAARLIHLKSLTLLPQHEEEAGELRGQIHGELMEYQLVKDAADALAGGYEGWRRFVREAAELPVDYTYDRLHPPEELLLALGAAAGRRVRRLPPPESVFDGIVRARQVSVTARALYLLRRLYQRPVIGFDELFSSCEDRPEMVATFLALLELMRAGRVSYVVDKQEIRFLGRGLPKGRVRVRGID